MKTHISLLSLTIDYFFKLLYYFEKLQFQKSKTFETQSRKHNFKDRNTI